MLGAHSYGTLVSDFKASGLDQVGKKKTKVKDEDDKGKTKEKKLKPKGLFAGEFDLLRSSMALLMHFIVHQ